MNYKVSHGGTKTSFTLDGVPVELLPGQEVVLSAAQYADFEAQYEGSYTVSATHLEPTYLGVTPVEPVAEVPETLTPVSEKLGLGYYPYALQDVPPTHNEEEF